MNFGEWEYKGYDEAKTLYPEIFTQWTREPYKAKLSSKEMVYGVQERSWKILKEIVEKSSVRP